MKKNLLILLTLSFQTFAGGPWVYEKNKGYAQVGLSSISYNTAFGPEGKVYTIGSQVHDQTFQYYHETGLGKNFGLKLAIPLKRITNDAESSQVGMGNITVGLKKMLYDKKLKISAGIDYFSKVNNTNKTFRTGFDAHTVLPYVSFGQGYKKTYAFLEVGAGIMSGSYSPFVKSNAEIGHTFGKRLTLAAVYDLRQSAKTTDVNIPLSYLALYTNLQSYTGVGLKAFVTSKNNRMGLNLSALGALSAQNVAAAPSFNISIFYKY